MAEGSVEFDLRRLLTETRVSELTLTVVPLLSPSHSLAEAAEAMREVSHGCALVCDGEQLVGIITERDLMRLLAGDTDFSLPIKASMTSKPHTISTEDTLLEAVRMMDQGGYRRLPVIDGGPKPAGIIDVKSIMDFVVDEVPNTVYNQASQALLTAKRAEGA